MWQPLYEAVANGSIFLALDEKEALNIQPWLEYIPPSARRAWQNIYELDNLGRRKLLLGIALYIGFALVVTKLLTPRKKRYLFKHK